MSTYSFYALDTGAFVGIVFNGPARALKDNTPAGCGYVEGLIDHRCARFDLGSREVVACEPEPIPLEVRERAARMQRDVALAACDWTQLSDVPSSTNAAWMDYRQALRDISSQPGFPDSIEWPAPPTN